MSDARTVLVQVLQQLGSALRSAAMYPEGHPAIHTPVRHLASSLADLLQEREKLTLGLVDDVLVLDEMPFYDAETRFKAVVNTLREAGLESITLKPGVGLRELETLVGLLAERREEGSSFAEAFKGRGLDHVGFREALDDDADPRARARTTYQDSLRIVVDVMSELRMGRVPTGEGATLVVESMRDLILDDESALLALTLLKSYDQYTFTHSVNVAIFSLAFAKHRGASPELLRKVGLAGLLHDVGKMRTAEEIIKKPGALTEEEMRVMQRHPELGVEILQQMPDVDGETAEIVLHHHVRYDGSGYPKLPPGREPHPEGVVVAVADCYDALTTTRPYQKSRHPSEAARIMRRLAGKAYAPEVLASFAEMIGAYPVGELVRLSTGELAVVASVNQLDATSPRVRLVTDVAGRPLPEPVDCDLAQEPARLVVAAIDPLAKGIDVARVLGI